MRVLYRGRPEGVYALIRQLEDEGITVHVTSPPELHGAQPVLAEINIFGNDEADDVSDAVKHVARWVTANFADEHAEATVTIADDGP